MPHFEQVRAGVVQHVDVAENHGACLRSSAPIAQQRVSFILRWNSWPQEGIRCRVIHHAWVQQQARPPGLVRRGCRRGNNVAAAHYTAEQQSLAERARRTRAHRHTRAAAENLNRRSVPRPPPSVPADFRANFRRYPGTGTECDGSVGPAAFAPRRRRPRRAREGATCNRTTRARIRRMEQGEPLRPHNITRVRFSADWLFDDCSQPASREHSI